MNPNNYNGGPTQQQQSFAVNQQQQPFTANPQEYPLTDGQLSEFIDTYEPSGSESHILPNSFGALPINGIGETLNVNPITDQFQGQSGQSTNNTIQIAGQMVTQMFQRFLSQQMQQPLAPNSVPMVHLDNTPQPKPIPVFTKKTKKGRTSKNRRTIRHNFKNRVSQKHEKLKLNYPDFIYRDTQEANEAQADEYESDDAIELKMSCFELMSMQGYLDKH